MSENIQVGVAAAMSTLVDRFVHRDAQEQMASMIGNAINESQNAIIEAGTGTGKTFAYLLPMLSSGKKVLLSTGTKALQDQLFYRDIPVVNQHFNRRVALLKGRANYLCPRRLATHIDSLSRDVNSQRLAELVFIKQWSEGANKGDLTEILDAGRGTDVQQLVTSTVDNCLGHACDYFDVCPLYRARQEALDADVVVVNHHLLFADLALREDTVSKLLPDVELVVFDEAHQVADVARRFYGEQIASGQFIELCRDTEQEQQLLGHDDPDLLQVLNQLTQVVTKFGGLLLARHESLSELLGQKAIRDQVELVDRALVQLTNRLQHSADRSPGLAKCYSRCIRIADVFSMLTEPGEDIEYAHWLERRSRGFAIHLTPIDIASQLKPIFSSKDKQWIFVSATLCIGESFEHTKQSLGLEDIAEAKFASPFDFQTQVCGYVPMNLPAPGTPTHTQQLLLEVLPLLRMNTGRTFILFTSHRALKAAAEMLADEYGLVFVVQGALPKQALLEKFRQLPRCILLATQSFWEGIDVRGAELRLLVIDKLPFSNPDSPIVDAQMRRIEAVGGNSFRDYSLPEAAITLKQGFGRLIREETDKGLFVLGDTRFISKSYGKTLKRSLPDMNWLPDHTAALSFFEMLQA